MCGIFGIVRFQGEPIQENHFLNMGKVLSARGPDHFGYTRKAFSAGNQDAAEVFFGHNRLSIIDLNPRSHQPMENHEGMLITYNGEIYNFRELKKQLAVAGYQFKTSGDTEVVLAAYTMWGVAAFKKFEGMFALAIWDPSTKSVVLARDKFGMKPLAYYFKNNTLVFASDIRPIGKLPFVPQELNYEALTDYFHTRTISGRNYGYKLDPR